MRLSRYTIIHHKSPYSYWYNTFSKVFFRISEVSGRKVENVLNNTDIMLLKLPDIIKQKLTTGGFLVDDNRDELSEVIAENRKSIESKDYFMVVLPTLDCNYRCWYCIQDHLHSKLGPVMLDLIYRHIDYMIDKEKITSLHLEWFGGEPFMYFDDVVEPVSKYAQEKCKNADIPFKNSATTNGYFLKENLAERLKSVELFQYQITLDGDKAHHDKVKFIEGCHSTFDWVLHNINNLLNSDDRVNIILRINYTHDNLSKKIVNEVAGLIESKNRDRVVITPRKVWQKETDSQYVSELLLILDLFRDKGFAVEYWSPIMNFIPCYANKRYYNAINYNGSVVKCTACDDLHTPNLRGKLRNDGKIEWIDDFDKKYSAPTYQNDRCLNCVHLPECMGLCPRDHVDGKTFCKQQLLDASFMTSLINYIDRLYE